MECFATEGVDHARPTRSTCSQSCRTGRRNHDDPPAGPKVAATHAALDCWDRDAWAAEHRIVLHPACAHNTTVHYLDLNLQGAAVEKITFNPAEKVTVQASASAPHLFAAIWGEGAVMLRSLSGAIRPSG